MRILSTGRNIPNACWQEHVLEQLHLPLYPASITHSPAIPGLAAYGKLALDASYVAVYGIGSLGAEKRRRHLCPGGSWVSDSNTDPGVVWVPCDRPGGAPRSRPRVHAAACGEWMPSSGSWRSPPPAVPSVTSCPCGQHVVSAFPSLTPVFLGHTILSGTPDSRFHDSRLAGSVLVDHRGTLCFHPELSSMV